jgi:hypothetical protein
MERYLMKPGLLAVIPTKEMAEIKIYTGWTKVNWTRPKTTFAEVGWLLVLVRNSAGSPLLLGC